jgi:hypothetical protein
VNKSEILQRTDNFLLSIDQDASGKKGGGKKKKGKKEAAPEEDLDALFEELGIEEQKKAEGKKKGGKYIMSPQGPHQRDAAILYVRGSKPLSFLFFLTF